MGRRRQHTINTQTWEPALSSIARMERAMVKVMATPGEMTYDDVLDCLLPPDIAKLLRDAYRHSKTTAGDTHKNLEFAGGSVNFVFDYDTMKVVGPSSRELKLQPDAPKHGELVSLCTKMIGIVKQHTKLRTILNTFANLNVTAGAAKHYWPTLQSLLPSDHAFFQVKGDRFKDVALPYETQELLREAPEIVAKGLLCDPNVNGLNNLAGSRSVIRMNVASGQYFYVFNK